MMPASQGFAATASFADLERGNESSIGITISSPWQARLLQTGRFVTKRRASHSLGGSMETQPWSRKALAPAQLLFYYCNAAFTIQSMCKRSIMLRWWCDSWQSWASGPTTMFSTRYPQDAVRYSSLAYSIHTGFSKVFWNQPKPTKKKKKRTEIPGKDGH
jgi:hypothetical protein